MHIGDFEVVPKHPVIADFQRGNTSARAFPGLQSSEPLLGIRGERAELVEFSMIPWGKHAALTQVQRRDVYQGLLKGRAQRRQIDC